MWNGSFEIQTGIDKEACFMMKLSNLLYTCLSKDFEKNG